MKSRVGNSQKRTAQGEGDARGARDGMRSGRWVRRLAVAVDGDGGLIDNNVVFFGRGAGGDSLAHQKLAFGRAETQRTGHTEQRERRLAGSRQAQRRPGWDLEMP